MIYPGAFTAIVERGWRSAAARLRPLTGTKVRAWLGLYAILLQAVLFAWHHHPATFAARGEAPTFQALGSNAPVSSTTAEEACELCAALHHLTGAPGHYAAPAL